MSRNAKREYILRKQEDYIGELKRSRKTRMLDETCETTRHERKYVNRLLLGERPLRERKGRGPSYDERAGALLAKAWRGAGCPCALYLKAMIGNVLAGLSELENVDQGVAAQVARMSAATMGRRLHGLPRERVWARGNRRSGNNSVMASIPCESGEKIPAPEVPPGHLQVDGVEMCGGEARGDRYWFATATDRRSQWLEARPSFNLCEANYIPAFRKDLEAFPFPIAEVHSGNGSEFMNRGLQAMPRGKWPKVSCKRSLPCHKNHNAHIEQKNGSVTRAFLGDMRLDRPELKRDLELLAEDLCAYNNFCRPRAMTIAKIKRTDGKGFRRIYDGLTTPCERVLRSGMLGEAAAARLEAKRDKINVVKLTERINKRIRLVKRKQEQLAGRRKGWPYASPSARLGDSSLRSAPPGPSPVAGQRGTRKGTTASVSSI